MSSGPAETRSQPARPVSARAIAALLELLKAGERFGAAERLGALAPWHCTGPQDTETLGFVAHNLAQHDIARECYARFAAMVPGDPVGWYNLATSERNCGNIAAAVEAGDRALALDPDYAQAALLLSGLRRQTPGHNHVDALQRALRRTSHDRGERIFLHYALGKEFEDLGDHPAAWRHFAEGAAARRRGLHYDVATDEAKLRRIAEAFPAPAASDDPGSPGPYGFIAGLPRSGTTLIERVLTGREGVHSNGETDNLLGALMDGTPASGGDIFDRVAAAVPAQVAASYARRAGPPLPGGMILEKLPLNYLYFGALARTMPGAKLVMVRRNPIDNCFAMFSTLFGAGYPFSYALGDLARYAAAFADLCRHWRETLGDRMLEVQYDRFVADPASEGQRLAAHMGIAWDEGLLAVERNRSASATASAVQVRRPIYRSASGRWRNYESQLAPLIDALAARDLI